MSMEKNNRKLCEVIPLSSSLSPGRAWLEGGERGT